jgi:hypothetical protein
LMNMEAMTQAQRNEAQSWIRDCSWLDEAEDLEDLTDEEVRRGIDRLVRRWLDSIYSQLSIYRTSDSTSILVTI